MRMNRVHELGESPLFKLNIAALLEKQEHDMTFLLSFPEHPFSSKVCGPFSFLVVRRALTKMAVIFSHVIIATSIFTQLYAQNNKY